LRIHHIGIAVADLEGSIELYGSVFGAALSHRSTSELEGQETALMRVGDVELELMRALREDSPVGKFVAKRGPGMHHVAYAVPDIRKALAVARDAGLQLIDTEPRIGLHGAPIAFVHPKGVGGVLTEFVETA
jgi:methylmalonyl-CoA epimerase